MDYDFDIFWEAYPLKKGKRDAEKHWKRYKPDLSEALAYLEKQKQERIWLKHNKRFVPEWKHGSTWVFNECWTDGYDEDFEKAEEIRDKLEQLKAISSKQKIVSNDFVDRDVLSVAYEGNDSACSIFNIRSGKLVGKKQLRLRLKGSEELPEIYNSVVKFYYGELTEIPKEILFDN